MPTKRFDAASEFLERVSERLGQHYLPQIVKCLEKLSESEIWWRPNEESNSAGNLALHLAGNVRQWIISGIGGVADVRQRELEFSERGPLPRPALIALLRGTVNEACRVLDCLPPRTLGASFSRQGYHMTRFSAISNVVEHFALHTGQIIYIAKLKTGRDLRFTHLPKVKASRPSRRGKHVSAQAK